VYVTVRPNVSTVITNTSFACASQESATDQAATEARVLIVSSTSTVTSPDPEPVAETA